MNAEPVKPGLPIVIAGPSGVGKSMVSERLAAQNKGLLRQVSYTTRPPRNNEHDGRDYHFVSTSEFQTLIERNTFAEWAEYCGHLYGTHRESLQNQLDRGHHVLMELEIEGSLKIRDLYPDAVMIFLLPMSLEVVRSRLRARGTESPQVFERRIDQAEAEIQAAGLFDYQIQAETIDQTVREVYPIIQAAARKVAA